MSVFDKLFKTTVEEENGKEFYLNDSLNVLDKKTKGCITLIVRSPESEHYKRSQLELSSNLSTKPARKGFRQKKAKDTEITPEETIKFIRQLIADSLWVGSKGLFLDAEEKQEAGETAETRMEALKLSTRLQDLLTYLGDTFLEVDDDSDQS